MDRFICKSCKWEITNSQWWNIAKDYEGNYLCDDCDMTLQIKERGKTNGYGKRDTRLA